MNIQRHIFSLIAVSLIAMPMASQADSFSISLDYDIFGHNHYKPHHYKKPVHVPVGYKHRSYHYPNKRHYKHYNRPHFKHHYRPRSYYHHGYFQPRHFKKNHGYYHKDHDYKRYQKRGRHGYDQHRDRLHGRPDFKYRDQRVGHHRR